MIVSVNGVRKEVKVEGHVARYAEPWEGFGTPWIAHSALYGDGLSRYLDVTDSVQVWGDKWPENWEEMVYGAQGLRSVSLGGNTGTAMGSGADVVDSGSNESMSLIIHSAMYGVDSNNQLDVTLLLRSKIQNNSLDLMVTNTDLEVGNPYRGQKKRLVVEYTYDGLDQLQRKVVDERDWLIIGQSERYIKLPDIAAPVATETPATGNTVVEASGGGTDEQSSATVGSLSPQALNDLLIRKFAIPPHRLRGPMPIEVPSFHRDDLARLFAELGFLHGAEIGVAEGKYSEVLLRSNPDLHLLCVDPWHAYPGNTQQKSSSKHDYAYSETRRRTADYKAQLIMKTSMDAVRDVKDGSLDFVYLDANHSYDYFMEDLINWSRKVRVGGIISGDDAYRLDPKRWGAGPMEGIYDYTRAHKIEPWFLIAAHRSVDFFYVKGDWK